MTEPLPTFTEIDAEIVRARSARAEACADIAERLLDVLEADRLVDGLLALRTRVAGLTVSA